MLLIKITPLVSLTLLGPVYMEWGTPVLGGWFLLFSRSGGHKTKETYPTRPGSPTPCKQGLTLDSDTTRSSLKANNQISQPELEALRAATISAGKKMRPCSVRRDETRRENSIADCWHCLSQCARPNTSKLTSTVK